MPFFAANIQNVPQDLLENLGIGHLWKEDVVF
jgi:hypothetical protein